MRVNNPSIKEIPDRQPDNKSKVMVCITNHIVEMVVVEKRSRLLTNYQRISQFEFIDLRTGEIREYSNNDVINRNRSFNQLRRYINSNFTGKDNEIFLTLTYANPEFNRSQVSADLKRFWKKLKYRNKTCEYIAIFEPHRNGAWHIHMLIKDLRKKFIFIDMKILRKMWGNGNVSIIKLKGNDNIGAYFSAVCKNININDSSKAGRIKYYPKFSKCFSHSANIKKPIYKTMTYENAMDFVKNSKEVYSKSIGVFDDDENEINAIFYKQFNSERKD